MPKTRQWSISHSWEEGGNVVRRERIYRPLTEGPYYLERSSTKDIGNGRSIKTDILEELTKEEAINWLTTEGHTLPTDLEEAQRKAAEEWAEGEAERIAEQERKSWWGPWEGHGEDAVEILNHLLGDRRCYIAYMLPGNLSQPDNARESVYIENKEAVAWLERNDYDIPRWLQRHLKEDVERA